MHAGPANGGTAGPTPVCYPSRTSSVKAIIRRLRELKRRFTKAPSAECYKNHFDGFRQAEIERLYLSSVRYLHTNSIRANAYYFEFGCWSCNTLGFAWKHFRHHFDFDFVVFDSFEGLPKISAIDETPIFAERDMCMSLEAFHAKVGSLGIDRNKLRVVKGYYKDSLTPKLQQSLLGKSIAVALIDCDLYESTVPVLEFIRPFLQQGSILIFDDWSCYYGSDEKGERKAFLEFKASYPELTFHTLVQTSEAIAFFVSDVRTPGDGR